MRSKALLLVVFFAMAPVSSVQADPIALTSGFMSGVGLGLRFEFEGPGFRAFGSFEPGVVGPHFTCTPCAGGEPIRLDSFFGGTLGFGTAIVGDTTFENIAFAGTLTFSAPEITAPSTPGSFTATNTFTFTGLMGGFPSALGSDPALFRQDLTGQGIVSASFIRSGHPVFDPVLFSFDSVRYDFTADSPAPVPEPATLLLVASGLGAALRYRKRRPV